MHLFCLVHAGYVVRIRLLCTDFMEPVDTQGLLVSFYVANAGACLSSRLICFVAWYNYCCHEKAV